MPCSRFAAFAFLLLCSSAQAQPNAFRSFSLSITSDTTRLDTLSIVPHSLVLRDEQGHIIPDTLYVVDHSNALLISELRTNGAGVAFRVFPVSFSKIYFNKEQSDYVSVDVNSPEKSPYFIPRGYRRQSDRLLANSGLEHSGSLMRGVNVSTNSSASLTSELSLQLSGKLTEELSLLAAISDKNLPAQPEGNTASLQEFDKIFISVYTDNTSLTAGDLDMVEAADFFGKYQRKSLGVSFSTRQKKENFGYQTNVAAGVSKGKFARQTLAVVDGNQGAYLLSGAEGEENIVVLSGSERVYVDGRLRERGSDADYIISYATAEITFMPRCVVTRNSRVVVEFEYSERSFSRYLLTSQNALHSEKFSLYFNAFYEGDDKNQPIDESLSDVQKQLMSSVGAQHWRAVAPSVDSVAFSNNEVLYQKKDTLVGGAHIQIYEYSANPLSAHYRLRFSRAEGGSYAPVGAIAAGRIYAWVGKGNGSHEPEQLLTTPKRKILLTTGGVFTPDSLSNVALDVALSNSSVNLFSSNPQAYSSGVGVNLNAEKTWQANANNSFITGAKIFAFDKNFSTPERFTPAEYERDWNIDGELQSRNLQQYTGVAGYRYRQKFALTTTASLINLGATNATLSPLDTSFSSMRGEKMTADLMLQHRKFLGTAWSSFLHTQQNNRTTQFTRGGAELAQSLGKITAGFCEEFERNNLESNGILLNNSQTFHSEALFLRSDSGVHKMRVAAKMRTDFLPKNNRLEKSIVTREVNAASVVGGSEVQNKLTAAYRNLRYVDSATTENLLLGREEIFVNLAQGAINASALYELGSGMELKQDYIYVEVGTGQGVYAWHDYNGNGVKELNEFEVAAFRDEASYIRVALPSREYVQAYTGKFAFQLSLLPAMLWQQKRGVKGVLSRFSNMFSYSNSHKNLRSSFAKNANPFFGEALTDTSVLSQTYAAVNTLTYLSRSARTRMELSWQQNASKQMLINGFENRQNNTLGFNAHQRLTAPLLMSAGAEYATKICRSQYAQADKNYNILQRSLFAGSEFTPILNLRFNAKYAFSAKENTTGSETSLLHDVNLEATCNFPQKGVVIGNFGFVKTTFSGEENSALGYEMLQGYSTGSNYTWGATFKRGLGRGLEFNLLYAGRKLSVGKIVHSGSVELRLLF
jgi:hypothetical protein